MRNAAYIARLEAALEKVAILVAQDLVYAPIFERLDAELQAATMPSKVDAARALIQRSRLAS